MLQKAIEESKQANSSNPDTDNMTYEQLIELGDRLGKVSKGMTKEQIALLPSKMWKSSNSKQTSCSICFDDFS